MDIETEKVIELLFPNGITETWKENPELYQYMARIGSHDIDRLNKEPDRLIDEKNIVQQNIQDLVFSNYKTFIRTAENSQEIFTEFNQTETQLNDLLMKIPKFINECKCFCDTSKVINTHKRLNSLILSKTSELVDILELPQLMESCLQNNEYSEALELSQYAKYLNVKYEDIPILENIVDEIENSWSLMINQVVDSLKEDLPLPKCLQLISLLRSMDVFTEAELRIKFIQARDNWLQGLLKSISIEDSNNHLTRTVELSRIHLFNIITQFKAIFNDDHLTFERDTEINNSSIFCEWLEEKVTLFLKTLEKDLPDIISVDSILGQCTYFGLSFGRVGADFTGRMSDVFIKVINTKMERNIFKATEKFEKDVENFTLSYKVKKSDVKIEPVINSENPPEQLVEYYPLAEYCNDLIAIFNELRLNIPVALVQSFTISLQNSLHAVAKTMFHFYKKRQHSFMPAHRQNMVRFSEYFSEQLIPYIQYCIHALFPSNQIATHFGTSVSQLQKEKISYLNKKYIIEPIESLLPIKCISMDTYMPGTVCTNSLNLISDLGIELVNQKTIKEPEIDIYTEEVSSRVNNLSSLIMTQDIQNLMIKEITKE